MTTVLYVQCRDAVIASLVTAADIPPVRLDFLKTAIHPSHVVEGGCTDKDCLYRNCKGNRVEVVDTYDPEADFNPTKVSMEADVIFHIVHGKNDRRDATPVRFALADGPLKVILVSYIIEGREVLGRSPGAQTEEEPNKLFVSGAYKDFTNPTFSQYWAQLLKRTGRRFGIQHFAPSQARTLFVEDFAQHMDEHRWNEAAVVMGNSSRQWRASYMPGRRTRMAQMAAMHHAEYVQRREQ